MSKVPYFDDRPKIQYILERYWDYGENYIKILPQEDEAFILELMEDLPESQINYCFDGYIPTRKKRRKQYGPNLLMCAINSRHYAVTKKIQQYKNINYERTFKIYRAYDFLTSYNINDNDIAEINHIVDITAEFPDKFKPLIFTKFVRYNRLNIIKLFLEQPYIEGVVKKLFCNPHIEDFNSYETMKLFCEYFNNDFKIFINIGSHMIDKYTNHFNYNMLVAVLEMDNIGVFECTRIGDAILEKISRSHNKDPEIVDFVINHPQFKLDHHNIKHYINFITQKVITDIVNDQDNQDDQDIQNKKTDFIIEVFISQYIPFFIF